MEKIILEKINNSIRNKIAELDNVPLIDLNKFDLNTFIKIQANIIQESIFHSSIFTIILNELREKFVFKQYNFHTILEKFPNKWIKKQKFKKQKNLYIFKFKFNELTEYLSCWENLTNYPENNQAIMNLFEKCKNLNENTSGLYLPLFETQALMMINTNFIDDITLKHEFIHYFQDITGKSFLKPKIDDTFETYNLIPNEMITSIFNKTELIPIIHNYCYILEKHVNSKEEALNISYKFLLKTPQDPKNYINNCQNLSEYVWFIHNIIPLHMIMLCTIYNKHKNTILNYISSYFNYKKKNKKFINDVFQLF